MSLTCPVGGQRRRSLRLTRPSAEPAGGGADLHSHLNLKAHLAWVEAGLSLAWTALPATLKVVTSQVGVAAQGVSQRRVGWSALGTDSQAQEKVSLQQRLGARDGSLSSLQCTNAQELIRATTTGIWW